MSTSIKNQFDKRVTMYIRLC